MAGTGTTRVVNGADAGGGAGARLVDQLSLPLLARIFGLDEGVSPYLLLSTAAQVRSTLPHLVLSVAEREGAALGSGSRDTLARARGRASGYADVMRTVVARAPSARIVKGASMAASYPRALLRPVGDADIWVPERTELWRAAAAIVAERPMADVRITLYGTPAPFPVVTVQWPSEDPWLDKPMKAELFPTPLAGNGRAVGPRMLDPGAGQTVHDLMALCEEGFQRPFNPKDIADVLVLADSPLPPTGVLVAATAEYALAPELARLLDYAARWCDIGSLEELHLAVADEARRERDRRDRWRRSRVPDHVTNPVRRWLAYGMPVPSVVLNRVDPATRGDDASYEDFVGDHLIARTPLGDFLATTREVVSAQDARAARAYLASSV